ncbi:MAG: hypothetical protein M5U34_15100 [Chloroflexi bacterium]|nr:hypothetical protein [Chloroflexota bacterium]
MPVKGREDYVPARLADSPEGLQATPVFGKATSSTPWSTPMVCSKCL